ncbi:MAG: rRNA small subunit methyltransferase B, partial [Mycobacteriales bacterium]
AGPGGKAALLGARAVHRNARLLAVDRHPHRARLVTRAVAGTPTLAAVADGTVPAWRSGAFDRVLVDAPCSGLGALRRRPEARWRKAPSDLPALSKLQRALLTSALDAVRPGGIVLYATCSPHLAETRAVVADAVRRTGATQEDVRELLPGVPDLGPGPSAQLWPHRHGTDAMFLALLRR